MSKDNNPSYPDVRDLRQARVYQDLRELTGSSVLAMVLHYMCFCQRKRHDFDKYIKEEQARALKNNQSFDLKLSDGWVYKTAAEVIEECMLDVTDRTTIGYLNKLINRGWLERRRNPVFNWDKTYEYRVNIFKLRADLNKIGYELRDWDLKALNAAQKEQKQPTFDDTPPENPRGCASEENVDGSEENNSGSEEISQLYQSLPPVVTTDVKEDIVGQGRRPSQAKTKKASNFPNPSPEMVDELFEYWQLTLDKPKHDFSDLRASRIVKGLKHYGMARCKQAIDGCKRSAFHMGDNDDKIKRDDLELIFRNTSKTDMFLDIFDASSKTKKVSMPKGRI